MDWLASVRKQAQEAVSSVVNSEAAELARQLAQQATEQATAFAKEATVKAQEVAKEALDEVDKSLSNLRQAKTGTAAAADPVQYGITPELGQFVRSLTYSTFSDYPLDSLDIPAEPAQQKLNTWQETHARLVLQQVPQLQDLRFVLSPKRMDEYTFWMIYFTLCKRYLPNQEEHEQVQQPSAAAAAAAATSSSAGTSQADTAGGLPLSSSAQNLAREAEARPAAAASTSQEVDSLAQSAGAAGAGTGDDLSGSVGDDELGDDELAELANDPELAAYLQDALQLDGTAADADADDADGVGSDLDDLDDYINKLDAEVSTK